MTSGMFQSMREKERRRRVGKAHDSNVTRLLLICCAAAVLLAAQSTVALALNPPTVRVSTPNGGERWSRGYTYSITWQAYADTALASWKVEYSTDGGSSWNDVTRGDGYGGSCTWVPYTPTTAARVRVTAWDVVGNTGSDASDNNFTILDCNYDHVPNPPTAVTPEQGVGCGNIRIDWMAPSQDGTHDFAQSYILYRNGTKISSDDWPYTYWIDTGPAGGFVAGQHYQYYLVAKNCFGNSNPTATYYGWTAAPIQMPASLTATYNSGKVTLAWSAVADADYHLFRDGSPLIDVSRTRTTYTFDEDCYDHNYCVSAFSCRGTSTQKCFAYTSPVVVGTPTLGAANPVGVNCSVNVELNWSAACRATAYEIQVDTNASFAQPLMDATGITGLTTTFPNAAAGTTHYWRVRASNANGVSDWSTVGSFAPSWPLPALSSPADGATTTGSEVIFAWGQLCSATSYTVQISTNSGFTSLVQEATVGGTTYTWSSPPDGVYYWRVKGCEGTSCSAFSSSRSFTQTLAPLTLQYPVGGETWAPGSTQTVQWAGPGPVKIELFADVTAQGNYLTGPSVVLLASAPGNSAVVTVPTDIATTRARIQISRTSGTTAYSYSPNPFKVVTPPAQGIWSYSAVDAPNHGYNQSDMCSDGGNGVDAVYLDLTTGSLRHANRPNVTSPWTVETVATGSRGSWPAIVRGSNGVLHVADYYYPVSSAKLFYTSGTTGAWAASAQVAPITVVQGDCSIVLHPDGKPMIAYDTGNYASHTIKVVKQQSDGTWLQFGNTFPQANYPHHITLRANGGEFWLLFLDNSGTRLNLWKYNGAQWVQFPSGFEAAGPYTDASIALDAYGNPYLAYTVPGTAPGSQKLLFQPWALDGSGFAAPVTIDNTLGTISSIDLEYSSELWPRIAYVGNGVVKEAVGVYSETEWPCAWTKDVVDATGNMDGQVSLVNKGLSTRWFLYRDLGTSSMRCTSPWDPPPAAVTSLAFTAGRTTGIVAWTAPGADGSVGQASAYDLRYSESPISEGNWSDAIPYPTDPPRPAGSPECVSLSNLACQSYYWAVKTRDWSGNWSDISNSPGASTTCDHGPEVMCADMMVSHRNADDSALPTAFRLAPNSPNPFNPRTTLAFDLPRSEHVRLAVYDLAGRLVRTLVDDVRPAGRFQVQWDGTSDRGRPAGAGLYVCRMEAGDFRATRRMMMVR